MEARPMWIGKRLKSDRAGALEGLPLYMIILVVITAIALAAIIALWPKANILTTITYTPENAHWGNPPTDRVEVTVCVTALNQDGNPINGASVLVEAPGDDSERKNGGSTGSAGPGKWCGNVYLHTENPNPGTGIIDIEVVFSGVTLLRNIPVL